MGQHTKELHIVRVRLRSVLGLTVAETHCKLLQQATKKIGTKIGLAGGPWRPSDDVWESVGGEAMRSYMGIWGAHVASHVGGILGTMGTIWIFHGLGHGVMGSWGHGVGYTYMSQTWPS